MAEPSAIDRMANYLGFSFGKAAYPAQPSYPSYSERQDLEQKQHVRMLLADGIKETPAEIAAREKATAALGSALESAAAVKALEVSCVRDGIDKVSGKALLPECKPFTSPKAF